MLGISQGALCLLCLFFNPRSLSSLSLPDVCTNSPCGERALEACPEHVVDVMWGGMFCSHCQEAAGSSGWGAAWLGCS